MKFPNSILREKILISSQVVTRLASAGSEGELQARSLPESTFDLTTRARLPRNIHTSNPLQWILAEGSHHKGLHSISRAKYLNVSQRNQNFFPFRSIQM